MCGQYQQGSTEPESYFNPTNQQTDFTLNGLVVIVRFEVLTAASMKLRIFWDVLQCS
jgi:hypothetical protein